MPRRAFTAALIVMTLLGSVAAQEGARPGDYRLGPQDKIEVRVHDLRSGIGEAHQWAAFDGEFILDATGAVSLPLIGELQAGGGTAADLARAVAARVQTKVGLAQLPAASVQVIKYRPFYITGAVDRPGEYDYRPGLTVLQASSIAGGLTRPRDGTLLGFERDALTQRGDLRTLAAERQGLAIRQARLTAEISEVDGVTYPAEAHATATGLDAARAMREETLLFEARRGALKAQLDAIASTKALLTREVASLDAKDEALGRQIALNRKELSSVSDLVSKGLAVQPRQFAAEQSVATYESNRIDIQVARLRARQDLGRVEREELALRAKRRDDALVEAAAVRVKLASVAERTETATNLIYQAEVRSPLATADATAEERPVYALVRGTGAKARTQPAAESDPVEPGDVLRVSVPRRPAALGGTSRGAAAQAPDRAPEPSITAAR